MSDASPHLSLPFILPSQNQKHVTHNEAITRLDAIVQLSVISRVLGIPPANPAGAARYVVGTGSGAWNGQDGAVAAWQDGAWVFLVPRTGWIAWVEDEQILIVRQSNGWTPLQTGTDNLATLGVNTAADTTNRLTVSAPATLLTNEGAGHQLKINKAAESDTASLLFQTGFSGRAEMGLAGGDGFSVKVSANGTSWTEALQVAAATGITTLQPGSRIGTAAIVHAGNLLGTVSQVAGQPTGAVIESGTNSNGRYVRFADGTQICSHRLATPVAASVQGALFRSGTFTWNYPAAFLAKPSVSGMTEQFASWLSFSSTSTLAATGLRLATAADAATPEASLLAVGRWY